ncbi:hypothetical protein GCM10009716_22350 [Streptomyces sodiiphilus]|uniref:Uncharacterized protein n=1 Tax=Streptomyces sodiiphilus TaxID=226217 RepID=A0ABN2P6U3_9ACTN
MNRDGKPHHLTNPSHHPRATPDRGFGDPRRTGPPISDVLTAPERNGLLESVAALRA